MAYNSHPNSLKNLKPLLTSENAREYQLKSAASRKANNLAREQLKLTVKQFKEFKDSFEENPVGAVDILRILMVKALDEDDHTSFRPPRRQPRLRHPARSFGLTSNSLAWFDSQLTRSV